MKTRRITACLILLLLSGTAAALSGASRKEKETMNNFKLAMQCWTFRKFTFFEAVERTAALGIRYLEAFPGQVIAAEAKPVRFNHDLPDAWIQRIKEKLDAHDVRLVAYGVVDFENSREAMTKIFDFAREMGIGTIVTEPSWDDFSLLNEYALHYGIKVAVHNHPPPTKYARPETVLRHVQGQSRLIGACGDTGHWMRTGVDPAKALKMLEGRVLHLHLKDLDRFGVKEALDVPFGSGGAGMPEILTELTRQNYQGYLSIEHENPNEVMNPEPAIRKGLDYIRSVTGTRD